MVSSVEGLAATGLENSNVRFGSNSDISTALIDVQYSPRKQTLIDTSETSALCQKQTLKAGSPLCGMFRPEGSREYFKCAYWLAAQWEEPAQNWCRWRLPLKHAVCRRDPQL